MIGFGEKEEGQRPEYPGFKSFNDAIDGRVPSCVVQDWKHFQDVLNEEKEQANGNEKIFRGHRRYDWQLDSKLTREFDGGSIDAKVQSRLFERFLLAMRGRGIDLSTQEDANEVWAYGQHFGLATPLLDWSQSPFVALFFAFIDEDPDAERENPYRAVFRLNKSRIENIFPDLFFEPTLGENVRLVNQAGLFTVTPDGDDNLVTEVLNAMAESGAVDMGNDAEISRYICKFHISSSSRTECLAMLRQMNIHHASLFPDPGGASLFCNDWLGRCVEENKAQAKAAIEAKEKSKRPKPKLELAELAEANLDVAEKVQKILLQVLDGDGFEGELLTWAIKIDKKYNEQATIDWPKQQSSLESLFGRNPSDFSRRGFSQRGTLKTALADYSESDQRETGINEEEAVAALEEWYERVASVFHGFDYSSSLNGSANEKLRCLGEGLDWVLCWQENEAAEAKTEDERKAASRAYQDLVLGLSKAFALAAASDLAQKIADELGYFQAIRAAIVKPQASGKISESNRTFAIRQLIDHAVADSEIVDVLKATGIKSPDISILSDDFLDEIQHLKQKNLALEALKKLLNGEIKSRSKSNQTEAKAFTRRLEEAVARYHANAISAVEMIEELIAIAKDVKAARERGEELGLSDEEIAFYDALAANESAVEVMGNEKLKLIAVEVLTQLRKNATVDWHKRESARADMRVLVKRILRKYGYPPDLSDEAVQVVIEQAERFLADEA